MVAGAATKAHNPRQRYLPYVYFSVSQTHYAGQVNFSNAENAALWLRDGAGPGRAVVDGAPARLGAAARVGEEVDLVGADAGAVGPQQLRQRRRAALLHAGDAKVQGGVAGERQRGGRQQSMHSIRGCNDR